MSQLILLFSTGGHGDYDTHVDVECSGRKLTTQEAQGKNLVSPDQLYQYRLVMPHDSAWYEVEPGDEIIFTISEWSGDDDKGYWLNQRLTYVVPENGLLNPPVNLDDIFSRWFGGLPEYYGAHAAQKH